MAPRLKPLRKEEELNAIPLDEPVLVELEPQATSLDTGEPARQEKPEKDDGEGADREKVDPGVAALREELRAAQEATQRAEAARLAAENVAAEHAREAAEANERSGSTERELVTNALASAQAEENAAKAAFAQAYEAGDAKAMAEAQSKIGRAAARVLHFEGTIATLEDDAKREKERPQPQQQQRGGPTDPIAAIEAAPSLLPAEKTWLKAHPEMWVDPGLNRELQVGHDRAVKAGRQRGTAGYFKFIEDFMGIGKTDDGAGGAQDDDPQVSAPVSRGGAPSMRGGPAVPDRIHLTADDRALARSMGLTDVEMAQGKKQLIANKRADPLKYASQG